MNPFDGVFKKPTKKGFSTPSCTLETQGVKQIKDLNIKISLNIFYTEKWRFHGGDQFARLYSLHF